MERHSRESAAASSERGRQPAVREGTGRRATSFTLRQIQSGGGGRIAPFDEALIRLTSSASDEEKADPNIYWLHCQFIYYISRAQKK